MVRHATARDAQALAMLAEASFRATFGAMNTAAHMDVHCRASYGAAIQAAEIADPAIATLLAEADGQLAGYAQLREGATPACIEAMRPGEIQRFYVQVRWHGTGVAQALMGGALAALRARGCDVAWLGVWERNPRAIAFYRKSGFTVVGEHVFDLGGDPQRDLVLLRSLEIESPGGGRKTRAPLQPC